MFVCVCVFQGQSLLLPLAILLSIEIHNPSNPQHHLQVVLGYAWIKTRVLGAAQSEERHSVHMADLEPALKRARLGGTVVCG